MISWIKRSSSSSKISCNAKLSVCLLISWLGLLDISDSSSNNPLCSDGGSASIQTTGGTNPITYLWSTGETTQSISNIMSSTCWVIATDSCGNTDSVGFNLIPYDLVTFANYNDSNHLSQVIVDSLSSGTSFNA